MSGSRKSSMIKLGRRTMAALNPSEPLLAVETSKSSASRSGSHDLISASSSTTRTVGLFTVPPPSPLQKRMVSHARDNDNIHRACTRRRAHGDLAPLVGGDG